MHKHFLNLDYPDLRHGGTRSGRFKQIALSLKPGSGSMPIVHWNITAKSEDALFLAPPVVKQIGTNDSETKAYYELMLPNVGGVDYTVKCRLGDGPEKTVATFQTWRRITLHVICPNDQCLAVFVSAFSRLQSALKPAFIEVIRGDVEIQGKANRGYKARSDNQGCQMTITLVWPRWESYWLKVELSVTSAAVSGHEWWSKRGNLLSCALPNRELRPQVPRRGSNVKYIKVTCEGKTLLELPRASDSHPEHEVRMYLQLCKIRKNGVIVEDEKDVHTATEIILDLGSKPLQATKAKLEAGKTVEISVELALEYWGLTGGLSVRDSRAISLTFYPKTTHRDLANVMAHELAHTMYLVKKQETRKDGVTVHNLNYHGNDYGGEGPHCSFNAKRVPTSSTTSGYIYEFDKTAGPLCIMHFKTDPGVDGRFCPICIAQLRRAKLPDEKRAAIDPD